MEIENKKNRIMNNRIGLMAIIFMSLCNFATIFLIILDLQRPEYYKFLWLLPFSYFFTLIITFNFRHYLFSRISITITIFLYFIRNTIIPLLLLFGQYNTFIPDRFLENTTEAIFLCVYETVFISVFIQFRIRRLFDSAISHAIKTEIKNQPNLNNRFMKRLLFLMSVFIIYIIIVLLQDSTIIRQTFMLMVGTSDDWYIRTDYKKIGEVGSGILGVFATLVMSLFWMIQAILPPLVLVWIIKKKWKENTKIVFLLIIATIVLMIVTGTRIHSLECALAIILVGFSVFKEQLRQKIILIISAGFIFPLINLMQKSGLSSFNMGGLSKVLSSYFGGIQNVAASIFVVKNTDFMNITMLPADILLKIPYLSRFFRDDFDSNSAFMFNYIIGEGRSSGQIIPTIAQGLIYFGFIFAPILSCFGIYLSIEFERKALISSNLIYKNVFFIAAIMMARMAPSTNLTSAIQYIFYTLIAIAILHWASRSFTMHKSTLQNG